jgi:hypothetical protein
MLQQEPEIIVEVFIDLDQREEFYQRRAILGQRIHFQMSFWTAMGAQRLSKGLRLGLGLVKGAKLGLLTVNQKENSIEARQGTQQGFFFLRFF